MSSSGLDIGVSDVSETEDPEIEAAAAKIDSTVEAMDTSETTVQTTELVEQAAATETVAEAPPPAGPPAEVEQTVVPTAEPTVRTRTAPSRPPTGTPRLPIKCVSGRTPASVRTRPKLSAKKKTVDEGQRPTVAELPDLLGKFSSDEDPEPEKQPVQKGKPKVRSVVIIPPHQEKPSTSSAKTRVRNSRPKPKLPSKVSTKPALETAKTMRGDQVQTATSTPRRLPDVVPRRLVRDFQPERPRQPLNHPRNPARRWQEASRQTRRLQEHHQRRNMWANRDGLRSPRLSPPREGVEPVPQPLLQPIPSPASPQTPRSPEAIDRGGQVVEQLAQAEERPRDWIAPDYHLR